MQISALKGVRSSGKWPIAITAPRHTDISISTSACRSNDEQTYRGKQSGRITFSELSTDHKNTSLKSLILHYDD